MVDIGINVVDFFIYILIMLDANICVYIYIYICYVHIGQYFTIYKPVQCFQLCLLAKLYIWMIWKTLSTCTCIYILQHMKCFFAMHNTLFDPPIPPITKVSVSQSNEALILLLFFMAFLFFF